jgi:hypothetical protein
MNQSNRTARSRLERRLGVHLSRVHRRLQKLRSATLWWMYPELPAELQYSFVRVHLYDLMREIREGPVTFHPFMHHRGGLVPQYQTVEAARLGLERSRKGVRLLLTCLGLKRILRAPLSNTLKLIYRDQQQRQAFQRLYQWLQLGRPTALNYAQAIQDWMQQYLSKDDADLREMGEELLAAFAHRVRAEKQVEEHRERERRIREEQYAAEVRERRAREASERKERERERERREAEQRERAHRQQLEAAVRALSRRAEERQAANAAALENLECLPTAPYADFKSHLLRQNQSLAALKDLVISDRVSTRRLEIVGESARQDITPFEPHLVGTMARRLVIRVSECGRYRSEAILELASMLAESAQADSLYRKLWCTVKPDRVLCLSYRCPEAPWQSVYAELAFERASNPEDLNIIVSVHIPYGEAGDRSPYPTEESSTYVRPTQTMTLVPKLVVNAGDSEQYQDEDSEERGDSRSATDRRSRQSSRSLRSGHEYRMSNSTSEGARREGSFPPPRGRPSLFTPTEHSWSETDELSRSYHSSDESSWSDEHERTTADESSTSERHRASSMRQYQQEARVEFTPTAIGIDFTDPSRLLAPWRANQENAFGGAIFDLICYDLPGLAEILPDAVFKRRRDAQHARIDLSRDDAFFAEVAQWALVERPGITPDRLVVTADGTARPIDIDVVRELVQHTRPEFQGLSDRALRFPSGQRRIE